MVNLVAATVIYFGGYGSTPAQMTCWENGARKAAPAVQMTFKGVAYPAGATPGRDSAVAAGAKSIRAVVDEINRNPQKRYIIAGHSSGAALANQAARLVANPKQIELVDLDGFAASADLQKRVRTMCVTAVNPRTGMLARNAASMRGNCRRSRTYQAPHCKTGWCLHFAMINKQAPADLGGDFKTRGYQSCSSNLEWLHYLTAP